MVPPAGAANLGYLDTRLAPVIPPTRQQHPLRRPRGVERPPVLDLEDFAGAHARGALDQPGWVLLLQCDRGECGDEGDGGGTQAGGGGDGPGGRRGRAVLPGEFQGGAESADL